MADLDPERVAGRDELVVPAPRGPQASPTDAVLAEQPPLAAELSGLVIAAWSEFERAVAAAVGTLPEGGMLDLTLDAAGLGLGEAVYAVSLTREPGDAVYAAAVSNALLPTEHRLPRSAVAHMVALGWAPPGAVVADDERFGLRLPLAHAGHLAGIVSRTLREIYDTPHPAFLFFSATDAQDEPIALDALGPARPAPSLDDLPVGSGLDLSGLSLADKVVMLVAAMLKTTPDQLPIDPDGDIGIRAGSAMVFVRVKENPPLVDVFSPVLTEVQVTEQLYVRLSELTHRLPIGRLYCTGTTVWASVPVLGRDFQATHLMLAVQVMTGLADDLDDRLAGEFGGKRFFGEPDKPPPPDGDTHTGMYL